MSKSKGPRGTSGTYKVGRGKPPKEHQFVPGRSGNPGGRRKGTPNLSTTFAGLGATEIELSENGRLRKATVVEALGLSLIKAGLEGDTRAINAFFQNYAKFVEERQAPLDDPSEQDQHILERALGSVGRLSPLSSDPSQSGADDDQKEEGDGNE